MLKCSKGASLYQSIIHFDAQHIHQEEEGCRSTQPRSSRVRLLVYMDKKYRAEDKKVVFITNCLPAIPPPWSETATGRTSVTKTGTTPGNSSPVHLCLKPIIIAREAWTNTTGYVDSIQSRSQ